MVLPEIHFSKEAQALEWRERKNEREKKVVTRGFYGQSLQFVFLAMCERKKLPPAMDGVVMLYWPFFS